MSSGSASCQLASHVLSGMRGDVEVLTACQEVTLNQREQTEQRQAQEGARRAAGAKTTGRLAYRISELRVSPRSTIVEGGMGKFSVLA